MMKLPHEMNPAEWLAEIREKYGLTRSPDFTDKWLNEWIARLPTADQQPARRVWLERRSRPASSIHDEMISQYLNMGEPVLNEKERQVFQSIFFCILPTYTFDAFAGTTPRGDRIVVLHHAAPHTLAFWSHWYLRMKDDGGNDPLMGSPARLVEALKFISLIWAGYAPQKLPDVYPKTEDSW